MCGLLGPRSHPEMRGRLYYAVCRFSATRAGTWLAVNVGWKLDPRLLRLTRGRVSTPVVGAYTGDEGPPANA